MRCIDICNHSDAQARKNIRIRSCDMPSCQTWPRKCWNSTDTHLQWIAVHADHSLET